MSQGQATTARRPARWWVLWSLLTIGLCIPFLIEVSRIPWECTFKRIAGVGCPGCGLTRSVYSMVHGDLSEALRWHAFGPLALLLGVGLWAYYAAALARGREPFHLWGRGATTTVIVLFILMVVYWGVRLSLGAVP